MTRIYDAAYEAGVMDRVSGSNFILSPPLIIKDTDVQSIIEALDFGLSQVELN